MSNFFYLCIYKIFLNNHMYLFIISIKNHLLFIQEHLHLDDLEGNINDNNDV